MPSAPPPPPHALVVSVLADARETTDALRAYLEGAGVASVASCALEDPVSADAVAVVIFPDELDATAVVRWLSELRAARPSLLLVVVTSEVARLRPALDPDAHSRLPIVLPRPAFGWTILDAIRDHARAETT
jgi:hypothetical protein